jgi:predicted dienelactone hydrolase
VKIEVDHDSRVKAAVVAAPALGFTFKRQRTAGSEDPDSTVASRERSCLALPDYADAVREALVPPLTYNIVKNADHYDFMALRPKSLMKSLPEICRERAGFDGIAFHETFNDSVVQFFKAKLASTKQ